MKLMPSLVLLASLVSPAYADHDDDYPSGVLPSERFLREQREKQDRDRLDSYFFSEQTERSREREDRRKREEREDLERILDRARRDNNASKGDRDR